VSVSGDCPLSPSFLSPSFLSPSFLSPSFLSPSFLSPPFLTPLFLTPLFPTAMKCDLPEPKLPCRQQALLLVASTALRMNPSISSKHVTNCGVTTLWARVFTGSVTPMKMLRTKSP